MLFHDVVRVCLTVQVEVAEPRQKVVKFGALRIGQTVKKIIPIVNNSGAPMTFRVTMQPTSSALQESGVVRLLPTEPITLQQKGGMAKVEVILSPKSRIPQFSEEVRLLVVSHIICSFQLFHARASNFICEP
jgi:hypothetical protein